MFVVSDLLKQQLKTIGKVPEAGLQTTVNVKNQMHDLSVLHLLFNFIYSL
jgi:hypothetical protein